MCLRVFASLKLPKKGVGSGSISQRYESVDLDSHQNVTDLQYCLKGSHDDISSVAEQHYLDPDPDPDPAFSVFLNHIRMRVIHWSSILPQCGPRSKVPNQ
jgi:hypothetical protein